MMQIHRLQQSSSLLASLVFIVILCSSASATTEFGEEQRIFSNAVLEPRHVFGVDIDGDDDKDVLVLGTANRADSIVWIENLDGTGTFSEPVVIAGVFNTRVIFPADLDGDDDIDILAGSVTSDRKVFWFENTDGMGSFGPRQIIATGSRVSSLGAADVDGDEDLDVVWSEVSGGRIHWAENADGLGDFAAPVDIVNDLITVEAIALGDLDGDDDIDVAVASEFEGRVVWFENSDGLGSFTAVQEIAAMPGVLDLAIADIDGDHDNDVVAGSFDVMADPFPTGNISWFENTDGMASFGAEMAIVARLEDETRLHVADLDGDDDQDVLYSAQIIGEIHWVENSNGLGSFGISQLITNEATFVQFASAADLDGDDALDVLSSSLETDVVWQKNTDGLGSFGTRNLLTGGVGAINALEAGDLDGDGAPEVIAVSSEEGKIVGWSNMLGSPDGGFGRMETFIETVTGVSLVRAVQIDSDADLDLVFTAGEADLVAWSPNTSNGTLSFGVPITILDHGSFPLDIEIEDIDNDTDGDAIIALSGDDSAVAVSHIDGQGAFDGSPQGLQVFFGAVPAARTIAVGKIDSDDQPDVVTGSFTNSEIYLYLNNNGTFESQQLVSTVATGLKQLELADLDGDNDLDIVAGADAASSSIIWLPNDGAGNFGVIKTITTSAEGLEQFALADFDKDGDIDVATASQRDNQVAWYENDGDGTFGNQQVLATSGYTPTFVIAKDLDGDGDRDIVTGSRNQSSVHWYENILDEDAFLSWASAAGLSGLDAAPEANPDGDGLNNLGDFAFNLNPLVADTAIMPDGGTAGLPRIHFEQRGFGILRSWWMVTEYVRRRGDDTGLEYVIEKSVDLENWETVSNGPTFVIDTTWERVTREVNIGRPSKQFGRLKLTQSTPP